MRPLTLARPKPMVPVAGRPLLDHAIGLARDAEIPKITVNTHYMGDQIASHLKDTEINVIHEPALLDTGGGLKNAFATSRPKAVFTMNSDAIWSGANPYLTLLDSWSSHMVGLLLCAHIDKIEGRNGAGDFDISNTGQISRGGDYVYLGCQILNLEPVFQIQEQAFSLNTVWDKLISKGQLFGCLYDGAWCDVGRPENITTAEQMLGY